MKGKYNIVLIADRLYTDNKDTSFNSSNLEQISDEYFDDVYDALSKISKSVTHYNSPDELINNIQKHKDDLLFTIYGGEKSRNRMALIPSICEGYNMRYCGADTYARIICQDKYLSKLYSKEFNLKTANSILIRDVSEIILLDNLKYPIVLKPNMEGSSIGITADSIVHDIDKATLLIENLLHVHNQPVLAEEFIEGKEVCFYIIGNQGNIKLFSALEIYFSDDESYLLTHLYTAELKHRSEDLTYREIIKEITEDEVEKIMNIYNSLGKMNYMRIDCRLKNDELYLIELTPDAHIGSDSGFAFIADKMQIKYEDVFRLIIHSASNLY